MVGINGQLAVVALDVVAIGLHQVAAWIREIPLALLGWRAVGLPRQPTARHRFRRKRFEIR
jgi:hypothetical protein